MPSSNRSYIWPIAAAVVGVYLTIIALPDQWKSFAPAFLKPSLHLGLDLQGGTQLDFRISESEMEKQILTLEEEVKQLEAVDGSAEEIADKRAQIANIQSLRGGIVEAIRTVLERRINSLGVSEAVITPSFYGAEKHLLVECPGVIDIQKCIATVGKTILLEFKEQSEGEDLEHIASMRALAEKAKQRITGSGESVKTVGDDLKSTLGVYFTEDAFFKDELPKGTEDLWNLTPESPLLVREVELDPVPMGNTLVPHHGIFFAKITGEKKEVDRPIRLPEEAMAFLAEGDKILKLTKHSAVPFEKLDAGYSPALAELVTRALIKGTKASGEKTILYVQNRTEPKEEIGASHILLSYKGAARAEAEVVRGKEDARKAAEEVKAALDAGADFKTLARTRSDGPSAAEAGSLGTFAKGTMSPAFEAAAFALKEVGELSAIIETEFGFHIIRLDKKLTTTPGSLTFTELVMGGENPETLQTSLLEKLQKGEVVRKEEELPLQSILFSFLPTGWKDTPLDGKHFRRASVTTDPLTNIPVVQIVFDAEGGKLFQELTKRNIGKPIAIFVGGELISAPTVQAEIAGGTAVITGSGNFDEANRLAQDLNTGAIPAPINLVGQATVEASLGEVALADSVKAGFLGFILVSLYMIFAYRVLGIIATLSLAIYAIIFLALLKLPLFLLSSQYIVLSLAGIAGVLLSIGMAVDANVLVFERMKEELGKGKLLRTATDIAFNHVWAPIRDSNLSLLITAGILFLIGTSIVRGFAVTLAVGIFISVFTAMIVTRFLIALLHRSPLAENMAAFGVTPVSPQVLAENVEGKLQRPTRMIFLGLSKFLLPIAALLASICLISLFYPGPTLSIEFTGGTLMEVQLPAEKTKEELSTALAAFTPTSTIPLDNVSMFGVKKENRSSYLLRMRLLTNEEHVELLAHLEQSFGEVQELKFTTIGPSVSASLKKRAFLALGIASLAIILYLTIAFRKIPRKLSAFRFGVVAVLAPLHTILILVGIFTVLSAFTTFQVDSLFVTALLSVMGYSVNDVIVILDRIRDNTIETRAKGDFGELVERSLQQTLKRTLSTGLGALIMLFSILFFGAESIRWFILALILGTFIGTYSSYFIATPLLVLWQKKARARV